MAFFTQNATLQSLLKEVSINITIFRAADTTQASRNR